MMAPIIEVKNLNVSRNGARVIENASFTVEKGDFIGVVGPNGGGKTTLIKAILGVIPKESGSVNLFGSPVEQFNQWRKIGYVSQDAIKFDESFPLSVRELVSLGRITGGNIGRRLGREDWRMVDEMLKFMGITEIASKRIGQLSGGQKQRVFVAKAMVRDPEILFLDEPVAGVDPETQEKFYVKLNGLNSKRGTTIIDVSHDLSAVFCRMSKVVCVNKEVNVADITDDEAFSAALKKAYGEHFHFVFHENLCEGFFEDV